ncbi:MAG: hypothetical protein IJU18_07025 [Oscillospiraceae bacterium]|nr:hypothetical protein [Oscillospiraceae bacterium]
MTAGKERGRRSHLNDFHMDVSGQYVYTGAMYHYDGPLSEKDFVTRVTVLSAVMTVAVIAAGCLPTPAMLNSFYVILPFVGEVCCAMLSVWATVRLLWHEPDLRSYVYRATVGSLPTKLLFTACFAILCAAAQVAFISLYGFRGAPALSLVPFLLKAAVAASALWLRWLIRHSRWSGGTLSTGEMQRR